ncbi:MAG: 50S ribosomal protein L6 [Acholeplasmatales bacterium]|jgi:large subunit ribosomal protein L6|nr:50S ribosomal protein L6 [Acholeplasmatales bacterium]
MSRVGNKIIIIPAGVTVSVEDDNNVVVKGPKGELSYKFTSILSINKDGNTIKISRPNDEIFSRKIHGTTRALLNNMVIGVSTGFKKALEIRGVGYRASVQGPKLVLNMGYSHPVELTIPPFSSVVVEKNVNLVVEGIDKQVVGEFAAQIRKVRKPEPYLGKGIRYVDEFVPRKAGKTSR